MTKMLNAYKTIVQAGMMPWWDVDPEDVLQGIPYGNVEKFISLDAKFKEDDKYMDFKMETDQGLSEYHDLPINLKWVQFFNRQLKFSGEERFMFNYRIFGKSKLKRYSRFIIIF